MVLKFLKEIAACVGYGVWYTTMSDEDTDAFNHEHLVICLHWVDHELQPPD